MPSASGEAPKVVLLVEDEPAIVQLLKHQVEMEGFAVMIARNGADAVEAVSRAKLSVVLLDLGLPDMSGFEVLKNLHAMKPEIPVVMVTGVHVEEEARKAFALGAWDYVTKPIDFTYLKNVLRVYSQQVSP